LKGFTTEARRHRVEVNVLRNRRRKIKMSKQGIKRLVL
jgi:hypothetical protein